MYTIFSFFSIFLVTFYYNLFIVYIICNNFSSLDKDQNPWSKRCDTFSINKLPMWSIKLFSFILSTGDVQEFIIISF